MITSYRHKYLPTRKTLSSFFHFILALIFLSFLLFWWQWLYSWGHRFESALYVEKIKFKIWGPHVVIPIHEACSLFKRVSRSARATTSGPKKTIWEVILLRPKWRSNVGRPMRRNPKVGPRWVGRTAPWPGPDICPSNQITNAERVSSARFARSRCRRVQTTSNPAQFL